MPYFDVITGNSFCVEAETPKEAMEKLTAYQDGEICPCEIEDCDCVQESEVDTWIR